MTRWGRRSKITFLAALLAELFLPSPAVHDDLWIFGSSRAPGSYDLSAAITAQDLHAPDLFAIDGVVGTAVGIGLGGTPVVMVYTARVGVLGVPASLEGIPVLPEVTGEFWALGDGPRARESDNAVDPKQRFPRPVPIGVSGGQPDVTAGTIGARVSDGAKTYALSNNHVFANRNDANKGDDILQPGRVDGGTDPTNSIGTLHDYEPLRFCSVLTCPDNRIDAAIALTSAENLGTSTPANGYGEPRSKTTAAALSQRVQKYGRTTGLTTGTVTGVNATINVNYNNGTVRFVDQILISDGNFSQGGDSGSLVVSNASGGDDRKPVGLLFAGSNTHTIANPIDLVLERFGVSVDGS